MNCQSSKLTLSRRPNPARKSSREEIVPVEADGLGQRRQTRGTALRGRVPMVIALLEQGAELVDVHPDSLAPRETVSRVAFSHAPPRAAFSVDSVRRRAARARSGSCSGHSRPASESRLCGCWVTTRYASNAVALRVSTSIVAPSISASGGPRREMVRRGPGESQPRLRNEFSAVTFPVTVPGRS